MLSVAATESILEHLRRVQVAVGYSGGLDSSVLLHWLAASSGLCAGVRAVHVHHGLHQDADLWAEHCRRECARLGVPLQVLRVEVDRGGGHGPEGAARRARHAAFASCLGEDEVLALAHHREDQAETFLLRALRASGADGLGAMRPWRRLGRGWLWRPLLDHARADLHAYAHAHGLHWIDDPSNAECEYDRNFLRQRVLPLLRERWPQCDAAFAQSAGLCAEAGGLLDDEDARALAHARTADAHVLSRAALRALPAARRARVLRRWIGELGLPPLPAQGIARFEEDLLTARADAEPEFAWEDASLCAWRELVHADRRRPPLPAGWQCEWDGAAPLALPDGARLWLDGAAERFAPSLRVHARRGGERLTLPGRAHSHALKHVLQDLGVPPWVRTRLPLLSDAEGTVLAAGDLAYAAPFDAWLRARGARLVWDDPR